MKATRIAVIAGAVSALALVLAVTMNRARCAPLNEGAKAKLVDYVRKKYRVPPDARLELADASLVGSTCYRKLEFKSEDPARQVRIALYATPDLRFLTRELLDSRTDPAGDDLRKQTEVAGVANGNLPSVGPPNAPITVTVFSDFECP
jgi:hypothetical protein